MHREDVFKAMRSIGIRVVIIWEMSVKEAVSRIKERKSGHRTITPDLNANMIVGRTAKDFEPLIQGEIEEYQIQKIISIQNPMSLSRQEVIRMILMELNDIPELAIFEIVSITDEDIDKVVAKNFLREDNISKDSLKHTSATSKNKKTNGPFAREGRYELSITEDNKIRNILNLIRPKNGVFVDKDEFHLTLLYMKRKLTDYVNGSDPDTPDTFVDPSETYRKAISAYCNLNDKDIPVKLLYVARNDRVIAIRAQILEPAVKYFDVIPHISLSKVKDAEFRESNELIKICESLRSNSLVQDHKNIEWIDIDTDDVIEGKIRFRKHGQ
jgi:hypothetical protein